ncbi:MAG: hypothetical protein HDT10_05300 [Helicobacter sp.]|nr:hypothetical protein [Helicobacter sp.]
MQKFAERYKDKEDSISIRTMYNRLYYALYHKILHDNPNNRTLQGKTAGIHSYIKCNNNLQGFKQQLYNDLYTLRMWADYDIEEKEIKTKNSFNLFSVLFSGKIIVK